MGTSLALAVITLAGTAVALFSFFRRRGGTGRSGDDRAAPRSLGSPLLALGVVIALIYLNQLLFTVYVLRVQHGDPSFIARYLPPGWFRLARGGVIEAFARWFPAPGLLAPTVLRAQAFLELPFVTFTYLTVCRWFSADTYHGALRLAWPLSATGTATFCLIEWSLRNPYTIDDIVIRIAAGAVVPLLARRLADAPGDAGTADAGVPDLPGLVVFIISTVALGVVVMTVYGTALLYNLGYLADKLPEAATALAVLALARVTARLVPRRTPGLPVEAVVRSLGVFLILFAVPALPLRYAMLGWGTRYAAAAAGVVIAGLSAWTGVADTLTRPGVPRARLLAQLGLCVITGAAAAAATYSLSRGGPPETRALWSTAAFLLCGTGACALLDSRTPREEATP